MNKISKKLHNKALDNIRPLVESLAEQGLNSRDIADHVKRFVDTKRRNFYEQQENESQRIGNIMSDVVKDIEGLEGAATADSKAEYIFMEVLKKNNIPFEFQYPIGLYRVDFLIAGSIVLECDGPHHKNQKDYDDKRDKFLEKKGYKVMRVSWDIVALIQDTVIKDIKDLIKELKL